MPKDTNNIKEEIKEQKKNFKTLSFTGKLKYLWDYYRFIALGVVIAAIAITAFIMSMIRNNYDNVCYIAVCEGKAPNHVDNTDDLSTGFTSYLGIDGKKTRIDLDYTYNLEQKEFDNDAALSVNKIYTLSSTSSLDGLLAPEKYISMNSIDAQLFLYDLRDLLNTDEMSKLSDNLVYYTKKDGTKIPYAVKLNNSQIVKNAGLTTPDACYGVVITSPHPENAVAFIKYVYGL